LSSASTVAFKDSTVCSVENRMLKRAFNSPGMTFGAPVPADRFETWKLVG
jgi:hypothetical protein